MKVNLTQEQHKVELMKARLSPCYRPVPHIHTLMEASKETWGYTGIEPPSTLPPELQSSQEVTLMSKTLNQHIQIHSTSTLLLINVLLTNSYR